MHAYSVGQEEGREVGLQKKPSCILWTKNKWVQELRIQRSSTWGIFHIPQPRRHWRKRSRKQEKFLLRWSLPTDKPDAPKDLDSLKWQQTKALKRQLKCSMARRWTAEL